MIDFDTKEKILIEWNRIVTDTPPSFEIFSELTRFVINTRIIHGIDPIQIVKEARRY